MSVVFILGAGASVDAGAPVMNGFLDKARDLLEVGRIEDVESVKSFRRVFALISNLQAIHQKCYIDPRNIESVHAALDMGKTLNWLPGYSSEQIDELIRDISTLISVTIENSIVFPINPGGALQDPKPYKKFAGLIKGIKIRNQPRRNVGVITFNYDLACDRSLSASGLSPDYCLTGELDNERTPLLKLHGSLNWVQCPHCNENFIHTENVNRLAEHCFPGNHFPEGMRVHETTMPVSRWLKESGICEHLPENEPKAPFIVPPTWDKTKHHRAISRVWTAAARVLSEADHVFIIGYSFPGSDAFFHYLYGIGSIGKNPLRRFAVFNPNKQGVEARFRGLLGRAVEDVFEYHAVTFDKALDIIPDYFR